MSPADAAMVGMQLGGAVAGPPGSLVGAGAGFAAAGGFGEPQGPAPMPKGLAGGRGGQGPPKQTQPKPKPEPTSKPSPAPEPEPTPPEQMLEVASDKGREARKEAEGGTKGQGKKQDRLRGRASTILTGGQGLLADPASLRVRTLLGA